MTDYTNGVAALASGCVAMGGTPALCAIARRPGGAGRGPRVGREQRQGWRLSASPARTRGLAAGAADLQSGAKALQDGTTQFAAGLPGLEAGIAASATGAADLATGPPPSAVARTRCYWARSSSPRACRR